MPKFEARQRSPIRYSRGLGDGLPGAKASGLFFAPHFSPRSTALYASESFSCCTASTVKTLRRKSVRARAAAWGSVFMMEPTVVFFAR